MTVSLRSITIAPAINAAAFIGSKRALPNIAFMPEESCPVSRTSRLTVSLGCSFSKNPTGIVRTCENTSLRKLVTAVCTTFSAMYC